MKSLKTIRVKPIIVVLYILILAISFYRIDRLSHSISDTIIAFLPQFIILTIMALYFSYDTDENQEVR